MKNNNIILLNHNIFNSINKQINYKDPKKQIFYINFCTVCHQHLEDFFICEKLPYTNISYLERKTEEQICNVINGFLQSEQKILILLNDDFYNIYSTCMKVFEEIKSTSNKTRVKIKRENFCLHIDPYCYVRASSSIETLIINDRVLYFDINKIYNKKSKIDLRNAISSHKLFVESHFNYYYEQAELETQTVELLYKLSYNQYLQIISKIIPSKFLIVYYNVEGLKSFLDMKEISSIEISNKLSFKKLINLITYKN